MKSVPTEEQQNRLLNWLLVGGASVPPPVSPLKVALFTLTPNFDTGLAGTEVVGGSYVRQTITFDTTTITTGTTRNNGTITFPTATVDWGIVEAIGIYDSAGAPIWFAEVEPINITIGRNFVIASGALEVKVS
jgi:hypothetical protein